MKPLHLVILTGVILLVLVAYLAIQNFLTFGPEIELNAPGGITDYCERYGAMLLGLSSATVDAQLWSAENYEKVAESWGDTPTAEYISEKSAWRDERLAALDAHLKTSPGFTRG